MHGRIPRLVLAAPLAAVLALALSASRPFAMGGAETPALRSISSRLDGAISTVLIEASEPVAYLTSQPDPLTLFVDLRRPRPEVLDRLARQLRDAPSGGSQLTPFARGVEAALGDAIAEITRAQFAVLDLLVDDPAGAPSQQQQAADLLAAARRRWPLDSELVNLAGYHAKNDYLLEHWDAVQAGRWPARDPRLVDSRDRFFESLGVDPRNPAALNGLANTLLFQREFDAAAFFNRSSIEAARAQGVRYDAAEQDAALIARFVGDQPP